MGLGTASTMAIVMLATAFPAAGQTNPDKSKLSAREIFYSAPKVAAKRPQAQRPKPGPEKTTPEPASEVIESASQKREQASPPQETPKSPEYVPAAYTKPAPLGIRCSVLQRIGASESVEVDPDHAFRSGDRIRLRVEANDDGYLYVVHRGSSGIWKPLFPSAEIKEGNNWITAGIAHDIPQGYVFTFDQQPGEEKLFVVFSRKPVTDLEKLIYDLGGAQQRAPTSKPGESGKTLLAENLININDGVVDRLRNAYARDLIVEKVDDTQATEQYGPETAVYAVSATDDAGARVVVDFNLKHQ